MKDKMECEVPECRNFYTLVVTDDRNRLWRVCGPHKSHFTGGRMKFSLTVIHQNDAKVNISGDRVEVIGRRSIAPSDITVGEVQDIPKLEAAIEKLIGFRVHINQAE